MLSQAPLADFIIAVLAGFVKIYSEQRKPTTVKGRRFRATISRQVLFSRPHEPAGHKRLPTPHRKTFCTKGWGKYLFVRSRRCIADRGASNIALQVWRFSANSAAASLLLQKVLKGVRGCLLSKGTPAFFTYSLVCNPLKCPRRRQRSARRDACDRTRHRGAWGWASSPRASRQGARGR